MTWITWRRYRARIVLLGLYVVALVVFMIFTEHAYVIAQHNFHGGTAVSNARSDNSIVETALALLPFLIGLVLGTPIVASELERKTNRLAWLQGVTRTRWLLITWATLAVPTVIVMALLAPLVQWWASHVVSSIGSGGGLIQPAQMLVSGIAPIAIALFALTFGMFVGAVFQRFVSPYATSVVGLFVVIGLIPTKVLSSLAPKVIVPSETSSISLNAVGRNPWLITSSFRRAPGIHVGLHAQSVGAAVRYCSNTINWAKYASPGSSKGYWSCMSAHGLQFINIYQPASHYWVLQWREAGIYVALAGALLGLSVWSVRSWSA
jgi:ABC-type transport system involved in multi-copper enzyme maturation permease subunit